jgi:hypothetical protein
MGTGRSLYIGMSVYNYKQRIEYWLRRIDEAKFYKYCISA